MTSQPSVNRASAPQGRPIGIEVFYWLDRWSDDQASTFARVAAAGYDGAEISLIAGQHIETGKLLKAAAGAGIDLVCSTGLTPALDISSEDREVRESGRRHLLRCLDDAAELGSPILGGVTYAPWMLLREGDLGDYRKRAADVLRDVAEIAATLQVDLCLEVLNRFETSMFNTVSDCLVFIDAIDHESVRVEIDTFHMNIEEDDLAAAVRLAADRLGHVQVAANNRRAPQFGHIDWEAFRDALDSAGYVGWIVFETFPNPAVETGRSTRAWRPLAVDLDGEARIAADFMRRHIA
jgi:D-psicose/D-tagatose/L-ribulose 3-epimerase